jgi:serine/threonine-protein kinase
LQRIDPRANRLVETIGGVGANPGAIAVGGGSVWVGSVDDGTVSRVDPKTNAVGAAVNTGGPDAMVFRDGSLLVANQFGPLTSIDPATMAVNTSANPNPLRTLGGYASFAQGSGALWALVGPAAHRLDRINHGGQLVETFSNVGTDPFAVAAGEGGVWVLDDVSRALFRIDAAANSVDGRMPLGFDPGGVAVAGGSVWVTDASGRAVVRIDPRSLRIVGKIEVGRDPVGVVAGGGSVWVANYEDGTVSRIDPRTGAVVKTIPVGRYPATLATGAGGVWVAVRAA